MVVEGVVLGTTVIVLWGGVVMGVVMGTETAGEVVGNSTMAGFLGT